MVETATQIETPSDSDLRSERVCYIISQGMHLTDPQAYRVLIEAPRFRCRHCGYAAHCDENLCVPIEL